MTNYGLPFGGNAISLSSAPSTLRTSANNWSAAANIPSLETNPFRMNADDAEPCKVELSQPLHGHGPLTDTDDSLDELAPTPVSTIRGSQAKADQQPKLPHVRPYSSGTSTQLAAWKMSLDNKFKADASSFQTEEDKVRYMFSRLQGLALEIMYNIIKGSTGGANQEFATRSVEDLLDCLAVGQARRRMQDETPHGSRACFDTVDQIAKWVLLKYGQSQRASEMKDLLVMGFASATDLHILGCEIMEQEPGLTYEAFAEKLSAACEAQGLTGSYYWFFHNGIGNRTFAFRIQRACAALH